MSGAHVCFTWVRRLISRSNPVGGFKYARVQSVRMCSMDDTGEVSRRRWSGLFLASVRQQLWEWCIDAGCVSGLGEAAAVGVVTRRLSNRERPKADLHSSVAWTPRSRQMDDRLSQPIAGNKRLRDAVQLENTRGNRAGPSELVGLLPPVRQRDATNTSAVQASSSVAACC